MPQNTALIRVTKKYLSLLTRMIFLCVPYEDALHEHRSQVPENKQSIMNIKLLTCEFDI